AAEEAETAANLLAPVATQIAVEACARRPLDMAGDDVGREAEIRHRRRVRVRLVRERRNVHPETIRDREVRAGTPCVAGVEAPLAHHERRGLQRSARGS